MKPQCTTAAECLRELARVMEQFGFILTLEAVNSEYVRDPYQNSWRDVPAFSTPQDWQFAIAEVEGKPVFIGDELYDVNNGTKHKIANGICSASDWSWNPPRPKTVMVELPYDYVYAHYSLDCDTVLVNACKKALEELKHCKVCNGAKNYRVMNTGIHSIQKSVPIGEYGPCPYCGGARK